MAQFIKSLKLTNLLSFGPKGCSLELRPLTVLIGPNGAGKSNLIEAISLLQAAPSDLQRHVREGGGVREWLWKGNEGNPEASIEAVVEYPFGTMPLRYCLSFSHMANLFYISNERLENEQSLSGQPGPYLFFGYERGRPMLSARGSYIEPPYYKGRVTIELNQEDYSRFQSVLSQRKDPTHFPEITYLGYKFGQIHFYRVLNFGPYTPGCLPQAVDARGGHWRKTFPTWLLFSTPLSLKETPSNKLRTRYVRCLISSLTWILLSMVDVFRYI